MTKITEYDKNGSRTREATPKEARELRKSMESHLPKKEGEK